MNLIEKAKGFDSLVEEINIVSNELDSLIKKYHWSYHMLNEFYNYQSQFEHYVRFKRFLKGGDVIAYLEQSLINLAKDVFGIDYQFEENINAASTQPVWFDDEFYLDDNIKELMNSNTPTKKAKAYDELASFVSKLKRTVYNYYEIVDDSHNEEDIKEFINILFDSKSKQILDMADKLERAQLYLPCEM